MPPAPPARARRGGGVALGVLGTMLLAFFSIMFVMGRHTNLHTIYNRIVHDPRLGHHWMHEEHFATPSPASAGRKVEAGAQTQLVSSPLVVPSPVPSPTPTPVPSPQPSPVPSPQPSPVPKPTAPAEAAAKPDEKGDGLSAMDTKYKPTKEMVDRLKQDGYLVVTWANWHYQDFVMTWVAHVKSVGITGYIVGAMDDQLLQALVDKDINTFSMKSGLTLGDFGWGSKTFAKMGREKIRLVALFLELGAQVVIADVDVLWLRNPLPYFQRYQEADCLTSSDHLSNTVPDESLEIWPQAASAANIGIMMFREKSLDFVKEWIRIIEADETVWDQNAFNDLFRKGTTSLPGDPKHYFMAYNNTLKMGILPVALFASGHTFFTQKMFQTLNLQPYAVHATFQFSGTPGKRHRMREMMLFEDLPSYYDHEAGFITFQMDGVQELLGSAGPRTGRMDLANVQGHFDLVNAQIVRIRNALAIAGLTGRALVVPEIWCGLDRWWAPHSGVIPGSNFKLPFKCPLDHVFDLENGWHKTWPVEQYGPNVEYRESSFFQNPRVPEAVNKSRVAVEVCAKGSEGCCDGSAAAILKDGKIRVQEGLMSEQLLSCLSGVKSTKVLDFNTMNKAFNNFTNGADWDRFASRMRQYGSIWCCIHAHPGHIHYDLLWDVPHFDKFNRVWNGTWEVKTGP